jgi:hypothetical protein
VSAALWTVGLAGAAAANTDDSGRQVLDRINQYRQAPYEHAVALGYDPGHLETIGILPDTRFTPYESDDDLSLAASEANALAVSPETPVDQDPANENLATPDPSGRQQVVQTEAVLTFSNFIAGETAAVLFAENLLKTELNTGVFEFVLASGFSHAGASVDPGVRDGRNAWFSTLMLGSPARIMDMQMLHLINQVRAEPERVEDYLSAGLDAMFEQNQQIYLLPTLRFQPLFLDSLLYEMAEADVLTPEAVSFAPDNRMILNTETGEKTWLGQRFQDMTAAVSWENMNKARPVTALFTALLLQELSGWPYNAVIFSNHFTEAGTYVHLDIVSPSETGGVTETDLESSPVIGFEDSIWNGFDTVPESPVQSGSGVVTLCAGSAAPVPEPVSPGADETLPDPETVRIYGLVFFDQDGDDLYAPGEELAKEIVNVYPLTGEPGQMTENASEPAYQVITDNAGHFSLSLESGRYWVFETWKQEQVSRQSIYIDNTHRFVKMSFLPPDLL